MKQSTLESIPGSAGVFVVCLISFAILINPIAATAAARSVGRSIASEDATKNVFTNPALSAPMAAPLATTSTATITDEATNDDAGGNFDSSQSNVSGSITCDNAPVVTSNADSGTGSLRQAITDACNDATITFDMAQVVSPISIEGELVIDKNLTIQGPTTTGLTINGSNMSRIFNVSAGMNLTFSNLTISGGLAASGGGVNNLGNLTILNSTLTGNTATSNGGAILTEGGVVKIINSTISGNNAGSGGGGGLYNGGTSQTTITNSTVAGNNEGIRHVSSNPLLLNNTIVARNPDCESCDEVDVFVDNIEVPTATIDPASSNNLIGVDSGVVGISNGVNGNQIGSGEAPVNPLLGPLANNGGPTFTHALSDFSPAADTGNNALAVDQTNAALTTDQRGIGFPRILNGTVDIGAYEKIFVPPPPSADVGVIKLASSEEALADRDVVYTITLTNAGPDAAANVALADALPLDMTFVSLSQPAGWVCTTPAVGANGTVNCTNANLGVGGSPAFTLTAHIPPGAPGGTEYHNAATVSSGTSDPESVNNQSTANTTVVSCLTNPVVTTNADSSAGSLRQAIIDACDGSTITFDMNQVVSPITLTSGELLIDKNLTITGPGADLLTISGNNASRVFNVSSGTVTISGLTISQGLANASSSPANVGGGIYNSGNLTLNSCVVTANNAPVGGGIYNPTSGILNINNSTISGNTATGAGGGGGIANLNGGTLSLSHSTISGNIANGQGGGLINQNSTAILINSTISGNTAGSGGDGGGILNSASSGGTATVALTNCTITGNTAMRGSAIVTADLFNNAINAETLIRNSLVGGNNGPNFFTSGTQGKVTDNGNNLDSDGTSGLVNGTNGNKVGTVGSPLNALLAPLANYGGPTQTHALLPGSPAIDAANNCVVEAAHCGDANIPQLTNDQRGFERQVNGTVDLGAFESRGFTISTTSGTPQSTAFNTAFGAPLVATVSSGFSEPVDGGQVTFTAPEAGASATFTGGITTINVAINASGQASAAATANAILGGPYNVTATGIGVSGSAVFSLTNLQANQTITFGALANKTFGDPDFAVSATASSGLTVSLSATGNCIVSSPSPGTVHLTGAGACTITASQGGNIDYNAAPSVPQSFTINKANQTINFAALATRTFGDPDFGVTATASSGLPVSLAASGNCTVTSPSPGTVHLTDAGSCTITASQAGDANYNAAPNVPQGFTINKANQTITFNALANKTFGDPDFSVSATSSSGLTASLSASGNCTVSSPSPGTVHLTGAGSCTITASQAGNIDYNAASDVQRSFTIGKAASSTAVSSSVNPSDFNQSVTFTATVAGPAGTGTPTGTVQFKDSAANLGAPVALNAGGVAQFTTSSLNTATHTITAEYSGNTNFLAGTGTLAGGQVVKAQPSLSINDVAISEGNAGTSTLNFTVTLSAASTLTVSVGYILSDGTAKSPGDYQATSGALTFNPGVTTQTIPVTINGDISFEPDETFFVNLANANNALISDNQGTGTIQNDDALGGFIGFSQANTSVDESTGIVTLTVTRGVASFSQANTPDVLEAATVDYATDDTGASTNCAALNTGLASQRCDYTSVFGTLTFAANETTKTIDIPINLDAYNEGPEVFTVKLSNPTGGAVAAPSTATVTINDSASPTPNAIDDTTNFVRQQYRDFLNREADAPGLAFWKDNIDKCNDPARRPANQTVAQCIEVQRIVTSAAFFLSIEFKQTGGLVRDFYVAALDRPATNNMPNFVEFMRDTQAIQKGVVVGQGNWQQVLDANRLAFMNDFVTRAEFAGLYPATDTPTQYVDKLYLHANATPGSQQERLDAIGEFGGAVTAADPGARGRALLRVTQNAAFQAREANRTFVQIVYFGYLRRDPDLAGYNFWVNKLNQFNGNFLDAEIVKAFLSSLEYRGRFGP